MEPFRINQNLQTQTSIAMISWLKQKKKIEYENSTLQKNMWFNFVAARPKYKLQLAFSGVFFVTRVCGACIASFDRLSNALIKITKQQQQQKANDDTLLEKKMSFHNN